MKKFIFILIVFFIISCKKEEIPVADFTSSAININVNESVNFTDKSTNNPRLWLWTFEGGTPSTSTEQNPQISYSVAGKYSVTLKVTNSAGSNTITKNAFIKVGSGFSGSWEKLSSFSPFFYSNYPRPIIGFNNKIYIGAWSDGIFSSSDNGATWNECNNGISKLEEPEYPYTEYFGIRSLYSKENFMLATTESGIYKTTDGIHWNRISGRIFKEIIEINNILFASTPGQGGSLYKSIDQGITWTNVIVLGVGEEVLSFGLLDSATLFVSLSGIPGVWCSIYISDNLGYSWQKLSDEEFDILIRANNLLLGSRGLGCGGSGTGGNLVSSDNGISWSYIDGGNFYNYVKYNSFYITNNPYLIDQNFNITSISDGTYFESERAGLTIINSYVYCFDASGIYRRSLSAFH